MDIQTIKLSEIDAEIIPLIRKVDTDSDSYKGLKFSIQQDGQKNPILIRELTAEEKGNSDLLYGIIDGHHRFYIAKENNFDTILAKIETRESDKNNTYLDKVLAYRLNESSIKMSPMDKGKVIYELSQQEQKDIPVIGKEIFNLEKAMSYRLVRDYKKSIGETTIRKPRPTKFNSAVLQESFSKINQDIENLPESEFENQLEVIKATQQQLKYLQSLLESKMKKI